ncbi:MULTISPECIES: CDP-diacylglycerol--glycerol-3-phosphate 3-phosphatidyltransferase [unclassified Brachybacterium]|uniref:CDP-diacylglycerol--glycerol-3-phosphate 3-phosphatidyltransferase n=1 Tax=unclassified Brachybacterium TaxID=2623841 RepID=UPI000C80CC61|nr:MULTISPECIES: CDP-diacylglycerol--glycerol-3-phosphate 3-phosphatidyltransferase [unclassified Brachybacterium]PMC75017.1 CDP-diacylglycerol--glycerol-3-phosphate 3-phosphatidyltransferase [Brachybacterium sp. UMB0905]
MSAPAAPQAPLWNIANILTMLRCAMVPVFVWLAVVHAESVGGRLLVTAVFLVAMATDALDGHLARSRNLITDFGKIVDPIADKAITGAAFIMLSVWDYIPWWMTILILVREFGITIMRFTILSHGALPANWAGKLKTVFQTMAITFCLLPFELWWPPAYWIGWTLVLIAVILTVWSGLVNLKDGLRLRREALAGGTNRA